MAKTDNSSFEKKLFKAADKLRKNINVSELGYMKDYVHRDFKKRILPK